MKHHRVEMLCSLFCRSIKRILLRHLEIIDEYNFSYETNLTPSKIVVVKAMMSPSARSIKIYYVISSDKMISDKNELLFIDRRKYLIIKKLKKYIKLWRFPNISFEYDEKYEESIREKIFEKLQDDNSDLEK